MGQFLTSFENFSFYQSYKVLAFGVVAPVLLGTLCFNLFKNRKDSKNTLVISFDDDDDLDEKTIIALIDKQSQMGKFQQIRDRFDNERRLILRGYNRNTQLPIDQRIQYINTCLKYDELLQKTLEQNMLDLADIYNLKIDEIYRSQIKYINNTNSHKILARNEALNAKAPEFLTQETALEIKHEMEEYAYGQHQFYMQFFMSLQQPNEQYSLLSERRLQAEEIINVSGLVFNDEDVDPDKIIYKSTIVAKYLTIDMILEKEYKITEAQLKRMLYKNEFDRLDSNQTFFGKLSKWIFG